MNLDDSIGMNGPLMYKAIKELSNEEEIKEFIKQYYNKGIQNGMCEDDAIELTKLSLLFLAENLFNNENRIEKQEYDQWANTMRKFFNTSMPSYESVDSALMESGEEILRILQKY